MATLTIPAEVETLWAAFDLAATAHDEVMERWIAEVAAARKARRPFDEALKAELDEADDACQAIDHLLDDLGYDPYDRTGPVADPLR